MRDSAHRIGVMRVQDDLAYFSSAERAGFGQKILSPTR